MAKTRTFIAIAPGDEVVERAERALLRLRRLADSVKWVERTNFHWTLHFLGELTDQEVYDVCQAAQQAVVDFSSFGLTSTGVGAFPSIERPRTLWLGASEGSEKLIILHTALEKELRPLGFRGENRRFVPHLTLGRASRNLRPAELVALRSEIEKMNDFEGGNQPVEALTVYASRLRREGPEYAALATMPLGG